jgi:hypothetical protein
MYNQMGSPIPVLKKRKRKQIRLLYFGSLDKPVEIPEKTEHIWLVNHKNYVGVIVLEEISDDSL